MTRQGCLLWAALFLLAWLCATYLVHFVRDRTYTVTHIFFQKQDCYVLTAAVPFLAFLAWPRFTARHLPGGPSAALVCGYMALAVIVTWAGHYLVFGGYSLSRDEQMAQFATFSLRERSDERHVGKEGVCTFRSRGSPYT